jgi:RHS repeat-associated protein
VVTKKLNKNQLLKVNDISTSPQGFKDGTNTNNDFSYDNNGNMTADNNKGIGSIIYNHLNLPIKINFGAKGEITYLYNATGQKVQKFVKDVVSNTNTTTDYLSGFQYLNTTLQFFPHAEGYVHYTKPLAAQGGENSALGSFNYVFNYTDHLGNVRVSFAKDPLQGNVLKILEENHYYPFGMKHENYNVTRLNFKFYPETGVDLVPLPAVANASYNYKYNGKEFQDELGLNLYDYGARNYDPALGRWMNVDPLAERYYGINPYAYVFNNPIELLDPDGMRVKYAREEGQTRKEFRQAKREFKERNNQLMKDSKTHRDNFNQLKDSKKNTHTISFTKNGSEVTTLDKNGNKTNVIDRKNGNSTRMQIDLEQMGVENEFVIAHETGHAIDNDNGTDSPVNLDVSYTDSVEKTQEKMFANENDNREANEKSASHTENIVRGEVSNSRGIVVPLRQTYTYPNTYLMFGKVFTKDKTINVIREDYDYYQKTN